MRVLVLGGYGLIGLAVSKRLTNDGHKLVGLGRSAKKGRAFLSSADWLQADMSDLTTPQHWQSYLDGIDVVVNASGALQDGLKDKIAAVQRDAITALIEACESAGVKKFIQISAPGVSEDADTEFYRTKAAADRALKESSLSWTIFRPGLVIAPHAYGGTSLVRMLAAFPVVQPVIMAKTQVQTVSIDDVTNAVSLAVKNDLGGQDFDLVETGAQSFRDLVLGFRSWLGFAEPKRTLELPQWIGQATAKIADLAGWMGWRPAMRTTAISVLSKGIKGDPSLWEKHSGKPLKSFAQTLERLPSTGQERVYARVMLVFPIAVLTLAGFWIASGIIGFLQYEKALAVLAGKLPDSLAGLFVRAGSVADIAIGALLLFRPTIRLGCFASIALATSYVVASAIITPELWADPLGPMVKVFPAIVLSLIVAALAEDR